jgi:hypothetical protein
MSALEFPEASQSSSINHLRRSTKVLVSALSENLEAVSNAILGDHNERKCSLLCDWNRSMFVGTESIPHT